MKKLITHISDTHSKHRQLTDDLSSGDFLIHSGDISKIGTRGEIEDFIDWFNCIGGYNYKIFIAGNHDLSFESDELCRVKQARLGYDVPKTPAIHIKPDWLVELLSELPDNICYLENYGAVIDGIKFWGMPNTPTFANGWGFNTNRGYDMNEICNLIPTDTDVLITHGPIRYHVDFTINGNVNVGCDNLYNRVMEVKPHLHFCGHIHHSYGYRQILKSDKWGGSWTFNGSSLNEAYNYTNKPINLEYDFETKDIEFKM